MRDGGALWAVIDAPLSRYTEAVRSIKLANDLNGTVKANRVVGLTSSLPNEGKSTIAFSLAQLMSQAAHGQFWLTAICAILHYHARSLLAPKLD